MELLSWYYTLSKTGGDWILWVTLTSQLFPMTFPQLIEFVGVPSVDLYFRFPL